MLNPLTTKMVNSIGEASTEDTVVIGQANSADAVLTGLASTEEVVIAALVEANSTVFLDVDCFSYRKQDSYDPSLSTPNKTIVGAINYLLGRANLSDGEIGILANGKVDKVTSSGSERVYSISPEGQQTTINVAIDADANSIVKRDIDGNIFVGKPSQAQHAASKQYVDTKSGETIAIAKAYTDFVVTKRTGIQYDIIGE